VTFADDRIDTRQRGSQCVSAAGVPKRAYRSRKAAERFAKRTNQDHRNDEPALAYLCPVGRDHWHVGHSDGRL
jgi:hypothetical protein